MKPPKTTAQERKRLRDQVAGMRFVCCLDSPNLHSGNCLVGRLERALEDLETAIENTVNAYADGRRDERAAIVAWLRGLAAQAPTAPSGYGGLVAFSAELTTGFADDIETGAHEARKGGG